VGDVGQVHHHAQPVHLSHHSLQTLSSESLGVKLGLSFKSK
jgi:hypothetical protein